MSLDAQQVMLAHSWTEESETDPTGYWMAEKLDGIRAYFDGTHFYSRAGNKFTVPAFFSEHLPKDQPLDGELWLGRGRFQQCTSIVKNQKAARADEWKEMTYLVFDAPKLDAVYEKRLDYLKSIMPTYGKDQIQGNGYSWNIPPYARLVPVQKCVSKSHLLRELDHVQTHGGEGIMLRAPRSRYEFKRSKTLLKVKTFFDEEAIVVGIQKGSGKHSHRMGHLEVKTPDGRAFSVGTGFTDAQRDKPPKVGTVITYKFQELSLRLNPRFPSFVGERIDVKWTDYCKTYKAPTLKQATPTKVVSLLKQKSLIFQSDDSDDDSGLTGKAATSDTAKIASDCHKDDSKPVASAASTSSSGSNSTIQKRPRGAGGNSDDDNIPLCKYGASCYRKNPDHLKQYSHPHKKARS